MQRSISDLIKRYGIAGIVCNMALKILTVFKIYLEPNYCLTKDLDPKIVSEIEDNPCYAHFRELSYEDFIRYGDKNWFTEQKLAFMLPNFKGQHKAYGLVENDLIVCSAWISLRQFGDDLFKVMPELKANHGYLWDDYTHPSFRGKGLHRQLINYRLYQLCKSDCERAYAFVATYNKASYRGFLRCGFEKKQIFWNYKIGRGKAKTTFQYE